MGETNLYRSSAAEITPSATRVCACTCLSSGVSGSLSRKAFTRPAMSWHMGRIVGGADVDVAGSGTGGAGAGSCLSSGRSGISLGAIVHVYVQKQNCVVVLELFASISTLLLRVSMRIRLLLDGRVAFFSVAELRGRVFGDKREG